MKKELVAMALILLAFSTGMIVTAATSGCGAHDAGSVQAHIGNSSALLDRVESN